MVRVMSGVLFPLQKTPSFNGIIVHLVQRHDGIPRKVESPIWMFPKNRGFGFSPQNGLVSNHGKTLTNNS